MFEVIWVFVDVVGWEVVVAVVVLLLPVVGAGMISSFPPLDTVSRRYSV